MVEAVLCYNRGCGKTFIPGDDNEGDKDPCLHHPGAPFFHDAYKGWTCCGKKATDFTEFLNFPGCTRGKHSRVKPIEPENITGNLRGVEEERPAPTPQPLSSSQTILKRPPWDSPLVRVKATVAASLRRELEINPLRAETSVADGDGDVKIGDSCKNAGCNVGFTGDLNDSRICRHHNGVPIFHEGMKYWSCCQRKTSDFQSFLNQEGCQEGKHCWIKPVDGFEKNVNCRYDWHQTGNKMTIAIYAKKYDPDSSYVEVNPIRLKVHLVFPEQDGNFDLDLELKGVICTEKTTVAMMGTKLEIQLIKAEPGSWSHLSLPSRSNQQLPASGNGNKDVGVKKEEESKVDALDLDDLELDGPGGRWTLSAEASAKS